MRHLLRPVPLLALIGLFLLLVWVINLATLGGVVWSTESVQAVAVATTQGRRVGQGPMPVREGLFAARIDPLRRLLPLGRGPCVQMTLEFQVKEQWVTVPLQCANGFLLDYLPAEASQ